MFATPFSSIKVFTHIRGCKSHISLVEFVDDFLFYFLPHLLWYNVELTIWVEPDGSSHFSLNFSRVEL